MTDNRLNSDQPFTAFGRYLKSMRTQMGIPLNEVADEIRVSVRQLSIIEAEDHQQLPDPVYVKGILKAYARYIGVDTNDIIDRYMINRADYENWQKSQSSFFILHKKKILMSGVVVGVLVIVLCVYLIYGVPKNSFHMFGKTPQQTQVDNAVPPVRKIAPGSFAENVHEKLFLQIDAVEDTELKITIDDSEPAQYLLHPMDHMELEAASKISMTVGNAGGVKVFLNNEPVLISGKSGQVVHIELP